MGLKKLTGKVADYNDRLQDGKARKIEPGHVQKVLDKLRSKETELMGDIATTEDAAKRVRLERKLAIAREQIERAEWLLDEVASPH